VAPSTTEPPSVGGTPETTGAAPAAPSVANTTPEYLRREPPHRPAREQPPSLAARGG
jgi:hypothetical protein